jgi:hypothetical protein
VEVAVAKTYLDGVRLGVAISAAMCASACARNRGPVRLDAAAAASGYAAIWVNNDLQPIGQLTPVGPVMVGMVVDHFEVFLIGIDPTTGHVRWRQQMAQSAVTRGEAPSIVRIGSDRVAYLRPDSRADTRYARLVTADASSGEDRAESPAAIFYSWPYACANGQDACAISHGSPGGREHQYRLDVATNEYVAVSEAIAPGARILESGGLLDLGDRPGNTLAWLHDGRLVWRTPVSAAFPPDFSSDNGWTWHWFADRHVIVGSVFGAASVTGHVFTRDLSGTRAVAALSDVTGQTLWRDRGSSLQCRLADRQHAVRCRSRGTATNQSGELVIEGLDVTVEGFDVATGETTWSIPLGAAEALIRGDATLMIAGPSQVVVPGPAGPIVLDYAAGKATAASPGAAYWCMLPTYYYASTFEGSRSESKELVGGDLAVACDAERRVSTVLPDAAATVAAGAQLGEYAVIAGRTGYAGFRLR